MLYRIDILTKPKQQSNKLVTHSASKNRVTINHQLRESGKLLLVVDRSISRKENSGTTTTTTTTKTIQLVSRSVERNHGPEWC
jgi:hypothetical protein